MDNAPTNLEKSVFKTAAWFSIFEYPLTAFEIWKWLLEPDRRYDLAEVYQVLESSQWLNNRMVQEGAFWGLRRLVPLSDKVQNRQERFLDAVRKYKTLLRATRFFYLLPGVRAVAAVNTLAWWHTNSESDIDLYIVTRPGTIWSSRLLLVLPFVLMGRRPNTGASDPFCFSFFATQDTQCMESLTLERDYYMAFWTKSLVPVMDRDGSLEVFAQQNRWADVSLPHAKARVRHHYHVSRTLPALAPQPRIADPVCRAIQRHRLPQEIKVLANQDSCVVINDNMLKFHDNDRRAMYRDQFEKIVATHL